MPERQPDAEWEESLWCNDCRGERPFIMESFRGATTSFCAQCGYIGATDNGPWPDEGDPAEMDCL